jgi:hypothetical protein
VRASGVPRALIAEGMECEPARRARAVKNRADGAWLFEIRIGATNDAGCALHFQCRPGESGDDRRMTAPFPPLCTNFHLSRKNETRGQINATPRV